MGYTVQKKLNKKNLYEKKILNLIFKGMFCRNIFFLQVTKDRTIIYCDVASLAFPPSSSLGVDCPPPP